MTVNVFLESLVIWSGSFEMGTLFLLHSVVEIALAVVHEKVAECPTPTVWREGAIVASGS